MPKEEEGQRRSACHVLADCFTACYDNPIFNDEDANGGGKNFPPTAAQNGTAPSGGGGKGAATTDALEDGAVCTADGKHGKASSNYHRANDYMHSLPGGGGGGGTPNEITYAGNRSRRKKVRVLLCVVAALLVVVVAVGVIVHFMDDDSSHDSSSYTSSTAQPVISLSEVSGHLVVIGGPFPEYAGGAVEADFASSSLSLISEAFVYKMDSFLSSSDRYISSIYNKTEVVTLNETDGALQVVFRIKLNPTSAVAESIESQLKSLIVQGLNNSLFVIDAHSVYIKARVLPDESSNVDEPVPQGQCLPIQLMECQMNNVTTYEHTTFPNILGHKSVAEVQKALQRPEYQDLFHTECYELKTDFYCSLYAPECGEGGVAIPPCRQYCIDVQTACTPKYTQGQQFPISCHILPDSEDPAVCRQNPFKPGVCVPVEFDMCSNIGFNHTAFPNVFGAVAFDSLGKLDINSVYTIMLATNCFKHAMLFACAMNFPPCSGKPVPNHYIPPCRVLCQTFLDRCEIFFDIFKWTWSDKLDCLALPNSPDPNVCVGYKETMETESVDCPKDHVRCSGEHCIHKSWQCDGFKDCGDNDDEEICATCPAGHMSCLPAAGTCILKSKGCDGADDCYEGEDEKFCVHQYTETDSDTLKVYNSETLAWEEVCKDGWTQEFSDLTCQQLGYRRSLATAYLPRNQSSTQHVSMVTGQARNGSDPERLQSYLQKGIAFCPSDHVIKLVCFEAVCGYRPAYFTSPARIVGGDEVKPGTWPWMVSLHGGTGKKYFCGATIIGPSWVLTAGHCVGGSQSTERNMWLLQTGNTRRLAYSEFAQARHPKAFFTHPDFKYETIEPDIALIQLERPFAMNDYVRPICLPEKLPARGTRCLATGWGKARDGDLNYQPVLKQVGVDVTSTAYCKHAIAQEQQKAPYRITDAMFCAGGSAGHDSCQGDSGGPLVCRMETDPDAEQATNSSSENSDSSMMGGGDGGFGSPPPVVERWYQGGIVSWGVACGKPNLPAIYTNLPMFLDWIHDVVKNATGGSVLD